MRICSVCSAGFSGRYNQLTCSPACGVEHDRRRSFQYQRAKRELTPKLRYPPIPCNKCDTVFTPKNKKSRFCSPKCCHSVAGSAFKKRLAERNLAKRQAQPRVCQQCGEHFRARTYQQAYCSRQCHSQSDRDRFNSRYVSKRAELANRICSECKREYQPRDSRQVGCSLQCGRAISSRVGAHTRRVRLAGSFVERVDPFAVFDRDGWTCQQCGTATPKRLRGKINPRAPELDHIVPVARGGEHSYRNTQCLCRKCNTSKGARSKGQMRLFG